MAGSRLRVRALKNADSVSSLYTTIMDGQIRLLGYKVIFLRGGGKIKCKKKKRMDLHIATAFPIN